MIYGQSGGGSKVTTLLGMPSAAGLIHRASAQSGGGGNPPGAEQSREFAKQVIFAELGVKDIAALQKMEWARLNEVGNAVVAKMNPPLRRGLGPSPIAGTPPARRTGVRPWTARIITMRVVLRGRARDLEERADADRLGERRRQPHVLRPDRSGVAGHADAGAMARPRPRHSWRR